MRYFNYFPVLKYGNHSIRDITKRIKINGFVTNPFVFLPYTVKEGEKAEDVAFFYYGSVDYTWALYLANDIIDPYYDWAMDQSTLDTFVAHKYSTAAETTGASALRWAKDTTTDDNIIHYIDSQGVKMSRQSYDSAISLDPDFVEADWTAIRAYDFEFNRNENNRTIQVIDKKHIVAIEQQLKTALDI
jgi:hypothetical protein